jgi:hypothetical protein
LVQNARIEKKIDDQDRKFGVMLDTKISQMVHDHGNMSGTHMDEKINGLFERLNEREKERDAATLEQVGQRRERGAAIVEDDLVGNPKRLCMALDWKDGGGVAPIAENLFVSRRAREAGLDAVVARFRARKCALSHYKCEARYLCGWQPGEKEAEVFGDGVAESLQEDGISISSHRQARAPRN